ncbi:sulfotransferase family protein [Natroniella sulfidigena]|uniref:sulfotransferase family 2 domain-containing protein n=1 Tax=Natroniella sulfidigena TaxID=723921 RepID=UPI00200B191D|nr:sulfotransferase family 2 domain-containing protein [Natroniella sulfidigena]MCK8817064.1 sulfotransferase family protein [Natroniella sulfidigena]
MNQELSLLIFMHVPKTAGTTLRTIIQNQYQADEILSHPNQMPTFAELFKTMSVKQVEKVKCITGHYSYGIHKFFERDFTYIIFLRNPIERVISLYYYLKDEPAHPNYQMIKELSLEEFIDLDLDLIQSQTELYQLHHTNTQTYYAAGKTNDLKQAKENLNNYFSVVGITEMFDRSLQLIKEKLNWDNISYSKKLVNKRRPSLDEIPQHIIKKIEDKNKLDLELYHWAKQRLKREIILNKGGVKGSVRLNSKE